MSTTTLNGHGGPPHDPPYDPQYDPPEQTPAHNTPAEQALLGSLLATPELAANLADTLDGADFHLPKHETIWTAITKIAADGRLPDPAHVLEQLQHTGDLDRIGGGPYLHTLYARSPGTTTADQAHEYARIILDASHLRQTETALTRLHQRIRTARADGIDDALADLLDELDHIVARTGATRPATTSTGLRDLSWILQGAAPEMPPPIWGRRTCGNALFYAGRVNGIYGDPEAAKTWLAQVAIVEALTDGHQCAFVDVDHNGMDHTAARLLLLGAHPTHLADHALFRYYEPDDGAELRAAITDITGLAPTIVVLDSVGEMLPMLNVKSTDNDEITAAMRLLCSPPARAGSCVITIDHLPKSAEARATGFAIGGTAKKRAIDGAYLEAEARVKPAPGQVGKITLRVEKDRTGGLRKTLPGGKYVGTFTLDSTQPHVTTATIGTDDSPITEAGLFRPTHLMETVSRFIEEHDLCSQTRIEDTIRGKRSHIRAALDRLLEEGFVTPVAGPRNASLHHSVAVYREIEDDQS